jgi:hypothetical protein
VTVIPSADAVDKILNMDELATLKIYLVRPNPDDHEGKYERAARRALDRLEKQKARSELLLLKKARRADQLVQ